MRFNSCSCKLNISELNDTDCENLKTMIYGIVNYVLQKFYLFVLKKLILMKITQVILILTLNT